MQPQAEAPSQGAVFAAALPTLLPPMRVALRMGSEADTAAMAPASSNALLLAAATARQRTGPHLRDAHSLLHLSSSHPWRNAARRREGAGALLAFIQRNSPTTTSSNPSRGGGGGGEGQYPLQRFIAAVVMLQRIWRGIICRRRLLRSLRARQALLQTMASAPAPPDSTLLNESNDGNDRRASMASSSGVGIGMGSAGQATPPPAPLQDHSSSPSTGHAGEAPADGTVDPNASTAMLPYQQMRRHVQRALPWPAFSQRAAQYERCVNIYAVMALEEEGRRQRGQQQKEGAGADASDERGDEEMLLRAMEAEAAARSLQQRARALMMRGEVEAWWLRERWPVYFVAAVTIQRAWLGYAERLRQRRQQQRSPLSPSGGAAANGVSGSGSGSSSPYLLNLGAEDRRRKMHRRFYLTKADAAAARLQDWWRRHLQRKIFSYFVRVIRDCAAIVGANKAAVVNYGRSRPLPPNGAHPFAAAPNDGIGGEFGLDSLDGLSPSAAKGKGTAKALGSTTATTTANVAAHRRTAFALLRQINYGEACMLRQPGSGLHVRFRLAAGGVVPFPPVIVFKVSAHAAVVDMGLLAPKDYVAEGRRAAERRNKPALVHNKLGSIGSAQRGTFISSTGSGTRNGATNATNGPPHSSSEGFGFGVSGTATRDFAGDGGGGVPQQRRPHYQRDGSKGPTAPPLSFRSGSGPHSSSPLASSSPAVGLTRSTIVGDASPADSVCAADASYERSDRNPWRLADPKAIADDAHFSAMLRDYEAAARRSRAAARAERGLGAAALVSPALLTAAHSRAAQAAAAKGGGALANGGAKHLVSASRRQAATPQMKQRAVADAILATQRRWLAQLYASEEAFRALRGLRSGGTASPPSTTAAPSSSSGSLGFSSYAQTRAGAEALFRGVPKAELLAEVDRVRAWHEGLDYAAYRDAWLRLGASVE